MPDSRSRTSHRAEQARTRALLRWSSRLVGPHCSRVRDGGCLAGLGRLLGHRGRGAGGGDGGPSGLGGGAAGLAGHGCCCVGRVWGWVGFGVGVGGVDGVGVLVSRWKGGRGGSLRRCGCGVSCDALGCLPFGFRRDWTTHNHLGTSRLHPSLAKEDAG